MIKVTSDIGGDWFYTTEPKAQYVCLNTSGDIVGKMYPEYVPDPMKLWKSKCDAAGIEMTDIGSEQFKSRQTIYDLWEHVNANTNN